MRQRATSSCLKDFANQRLFRRSSAAARHPPPGVARKCPDKSREPPVINDESIRVGTQDLLETDRTVAMNGEKPGRHLSRGCKHNADLGRGYSLERGRKLARRNETAGEDDRKGSFSEQSLTEMPDPI